MSRGAPRATVPLNDSPEAAFQREKQALAARRWQKYADCFTEEARNEFTLFMLIAVKSAADGESYNRLLESLVKAFPELNLHATELQAKLNTVTEKLRRSHPTRADFRAAATQFIREVFQEHSRDCFARAAEIAKSELDAPDGVHLGILKLQSTDGNEAFGIIVPSEDDEDRSHRIWFKFHEGEWKVDGLVDASENWDSLFEDEEPKKSSSSTVPTDGHLNAMLLGMDKLRAADQTPWDEVEKLANELLDKYTAPADKGRIHWQAAHVYGQSDIRGHAADVMRHAKEALKYERDPIQRGWLFMYLGNAAELLDSEPKNFVTRRAEATRWYLKGYLELLPFNLPDKAPELPPVGKIGGDLRAASDGEVDPEQVAAEVHHAAQMKARKDAEFTRELVSRRDVYFSRLNDLYERMHKLYDKDASAEGQLREIASDVLRDQTVIEQVLGRVALPKLIADEKPPESEKAQE
ncbi:MAG: hypothetical protein IAG10_24540 [Planctomycetaceae bacterium]|nr:hypothetical protein [Planctomycetaceae bacterium]